MKEEFVPNDRAIWNSETAKNYYCEHCHRWVFSQYEGDDDVSIICQRGGHLLQWIAKVKIGG